MAFLVANSYLGLIAEVTRGTLPSSGSTTNGVIYGANYIPISAPQITPQQTFLRDEALRGSPVMVYDHVQGVRHDLAEFKSYLYADTTPILLTALLGGNDVVTGSSAPYTHVIGLYSNVANGSQPPSFSLLDFDGANYFTLTGAQADELAITFGAEAPADVTAKFVANPYTSYTSVPNPFSTPSISAEHMIPAWDTTITIGGNSFTYVSSGDITLSRSTKPIFTMGTQAPHVNFAGPIDVKGKFTAVVDTTADPFSIGSTAFGLFRQPQTMTITFTDPNDTSSATNHSISLQMSNVQFINPKRVRGKEFTEIEVEFEANANTTDASSATNSAAYSPIKTTTVNATTVSTSVGYLKNY